jgi:hypothetical protein
VIKKWDPGSHFHEQKHLERKKLSLRFARQRDYANAAAIYEVVALETLSHYLSYHDEDGALGRVVQDCVEGLGACLESEREDETLRERCLAGHRPTQEHSRDACMTRRKLAWRARRR